MQLDPVAVAAGVRLIVHAKVGSTNAEALALARAGERGPLWIVARTQSAGRGRRGRQWISEVGNLYATLLIADTAPAADIAQLSFVAALAVHDSIARLTPAMIAKLSLKWPNDVLGDGRKLCGVLLESEGARAPIVAVGIGINCAHHPDDTEYPATDLAALGLAASPDAVFQSLSHTMVNRLAQWNRGAGFAATRNDWLSRAQGLGRDVRVRLTDRDVAGVFEALDDRGYLLVRRSDGVLESIAAGDVFPMHFLPAEQA